MKFDSMTPTEKDNLCLHLTQQLNAKCQEVNLLKFEISNQRCNLQAIQLQYEELNSNYEVLDQYTDEQQDRISVLFETLKILVAQGITIALPKGSSIGDTENDVFIETLVGKMVAEQAEKTAVDPVLWSE